MSPERNLCFYLIIHHFIYHVMSIIKDLSITFQIYIRTSLRIITADALKILGFILRNSYHNDISLGSVVNTLE